METYDDAVSTWRSRRTQDELWTNPFYHDFYFKVGKQLIGGSGLMIARACETVRQKISYADQQDVSHTEMSSDDEFSDVPPPPSKKSRKHVSWRRQYKLSNDDFSASDVQNLLEFVHTGGVEIDVKSIPSLYKLADFLNVESLTYVMTSYPLDLANVTMFMEVYSMLVNSSDKMLGITVYLHSLITSLNNPDTTNKYTDSTFFKVLKTLNKLEQLHINNKDSMFRVRFDFLASFAKTLPHLNSLNTMMFVGFPIHKKSLSEILKGVKKLEIVHLTLDRISMSPDSFNDIANSCKHLTYLNVANNLLGTEGMEAFVKQKKNFKHLKILRFQGNEFDDKAVTLFAENCKHFGNITHLYLENNNFSPEGANALATALEDPNVMNHLEFIQNGFLTPELLQVCDDRNIKPHFYTFYTPQTP